MCRAYAVSWNRYPAVSEPPHGINSALRLADRLLPVEAEPRNAVEDGFQRVLGCPFGIGVLEAKEEFPSGFSHVQPVKKHRYRTADMKVTGRAWGEAELFGL